MIILSQITALFEAGIGLGLGYSVLSELSAFGPQLARNRLEALMKQIGSDNRAEIRLIKDRVSTARLQLLILEEGRRGLRFWLSAISLACAFANLLLLFVIGLNPKASVDLPAYLLLCLPVFYPVIAAAIEFATWRFSARKILREIKDSRTELKTLQTAPQR